MQRKVVGDSNQGDCIRLLTETRLVRSQLPQPFLKERMNSKIDDKNAAIYTSNNDSSSTNAIYVDNINYSSSNINTATSVTIHDGAGYFITKPEYGINKCSKCGKQADIGISYGWNDDEKLERHICKVCHTEALDKFYGINREVKTEKILYEKNYSDKA